jgi:hypothetical protein
LGNISKIRPSKTTLLTIFFGFGGLKRRKPGLVTSFPSGRLKQTDLHDEKQRAFDSLGLI